MTLFPDKKLNVQFLFQFIDGVGKAGLGNMELLGCAGIVKYPGQGVKVKQLQ